MTQQDFDDLAQVEASHWWFVGMREITSALLSPWIPVRRPLSLLDAGCGAGYSLQWLQRYGASQPCGLDLSLEALRLCRQHGATRLAQSNLTDLPFAADSFDLITCFDVLPHLAYPREGDRALQEFLRVLRPGGVLFLRVAAYRRLWGREHTRMRVRHRYTLPELTAQLEQGGFEVLRRTYALTILFPFVALYRWLKNCLSRQATSEVRPLPASMGWLNENLKRPLAWEASYLRRPGAALPFGLSAICVARRPKENV